MAPLAGRVLGRETFRRRGAGGASPSARASSFPDGWLVFLESQAARVLYGGAPAGERLSLPVDFGRPNLLRVPVRVNGRARGRDGPRFRRLAVAPDRERGGAAGRHVRARARPPPRRVSTTTDLPMRLGWVDSVRLGDVTLTDVPVGVLPDGTLTFETTSSGVFRLNGVLGRALHEGVRLEDRVRRPARPRPAARPARSCAARRTRTSSSGG